MPDKEIPDKKINGGYYTVNILVGEHLLPYIVFARNDFEAARLVRRETGYLAEARDIDGPRQTL